VSLHRACDRQAIACRLGIDAQKSSIPVLASPCIAADCTGLGHSCKLQQDGSGKDEEGSGSFLKKRTKKLLRVWAEPIRKGRSQTDKSFLLLFFKKEDSSLIPNEAKE
jgi:hypothetical protein